MFAIKKSEWEEKKERIETRKEKKIKKENIKQMALC
jgi:hypothetical protein